MKVLSEKSGWVLLWAQEKDGGCWTSLKLTAAGLEGGRWVKRNWWFGWNGERLSWNTHTNHLAKHHPEIYGWVANWLEFAEMTGLLTRPASLKSPAKEINREISAAKSA
jgi:hypothetical protein